MIEQFQDTQHTQNTTTDITPQQFQSSLLGAFKILSQTCPSSSQLRWAHEMISSLMKSQLFLDQSLKLIKEYQSSVDYKNLSKLVITTLSTYLKHQQTGTTLVKKINKVQINTKLLVTFFTRDVQDQIKQLLVKSYTQFIYAPGMETIRTQTVDSITNSFGLMTLNIKHILNSAEELSDDTIVSMMTYIMVARGIMKGPIEMTNMKALIKAFLLPTQYLCIYMINALSQAISSQNEPNFIRISGICDRLVQFFKEMVFYASKDYMHLVRYSLMKDQNLIKIVFEALYLKLNNEQQGQGSSRLIQLVMPSNGNKFIQRINQIKKNCCAIINHYAKMCVNCQSNQKEFNREQYKIPLQICKRYIQQIPPILLKQFSELQYPDNPIPHQGLYNILITVLANIARLSCFFSQCYKLRNNLFYQLCIPILQRKEGEEYLNAEDFKGKREDIMNMHNVDNTENAVCKLIQSYVDKIDGSLSIFSSNMYQAIQFHLSANPNNFNSLPLELTDSRFFKQTNYFIQIQCYLSVLTLFSYMSVSRDELVILIEKILIERQQFMFNPNHNGMFKASVLLLYTYYVDNFYVLLKQEKSRNQVFHRQILEICCENVKLFTENPQLENMNATEFLCLQIAALQSLDCISNCLSQKIFLQALFFNQPQLSCNTNGSSVVQLFQFFSRQLYSRLNINVIDNLLQFFVQIIKNSCQSGFANKRFHYEKEVINIPLIYKRDVCNIFSQKLYQVFSTQSIPNHSLMKHKILHLLQVIITCCEDPHIFLNDYFFSLAIQEKQTWEASRPIDIYLRRILANRQNVNAVNVKILEKILISSMQLLQFSCKDYNMHNLFGILINLMMIEPEIIDEMGPFLANTLIKMLKVQDYSCNFQEQLQNFIEKLAYLNLIAINLRFNERTKDNWCFLIERIHQFLQNRATKGLIGAKSAPYIGKLLTLCLVCLYSMKRHFNLSETPASVFLWNNIVRSADIYVTSAERQIFSSIFILMLDEKGVINDKDLQSRHCFTMTSHVLYKTYSKALKGLEEDYGDNKQEQQSSGLDSDSDEEHIQKDQLNYREYSIAVNQYSRKQVKEKYIGDFKGLCHKLKKISPQFLRDTIESLPIPIKNFVKTQVFYFEPGTSDSAAMRKLFKVKKQVNYSQ